jgi:hypothetical protein
VHTGNQVIVRGSAGEVIGTVSNAGVVRALSLPHAG